MALQTRGASKQIRDYLIKERIGVGSYGMIYKVTTKNSKQCFVLKQIPFLTSDNKQEIEEVKNEASILSQLNSKFVVKYYDSFEENNCLNIVMEFCEGGDLCSYLSTMKKYTKTLNENQIWKFFIQLSLGLDYIHKRKILHRDLKTMNIFLTKELDIKIGDLGVAKRLLNTAHAYTFIGTPFYLSPEICEEKPYNEKSDVWALGCILYEMMTFKHPFNATNQAALFIKILNGTYEPIVHKYSKELKTMIDMLLEKDYFKRPSIRQVIETPLFLSKAKALGMLDIVIDTLSFFNQNVNNKMKMIKIASIHKVKVKANANSSKGKVKRRKKENSVKKNSLGQSEQESQSSKGNKANANSCCASNSISTKESNQMKASVATPEVIGSEQFIRKPTPQAEKKKLVLPTNLLKANQLHLKKPGVNIFQYNNGNGIMGKLNQISNDYSKAKEDDYNCMVSSRKRQPFKAQDKDKPQPYSNSNKLQLPPDSKLTLEDIPAKKAERKRKEKPMLHINSIKRHCSPSLLNQAKENQKSFINKVKSAKEASSDIYQFVKELDKKTLKLSSIHTIKKSKTNDKLHHGVPLFKSADDQFISNLVEVHSKKDIRTLDDPSMESIAMNSAECFEDDSSQSNEYCSEEDEEENETVSIIRSSEYVKRQESEMMKELNERKQSLEQFKAKYSYYLSGIMKYSDVIDCDYFFNLYKQLENNENVDEKTNKIIEYIHKTIPNDEAEFTKLFHNFIVYEVKLRESEKELKAWPMPK